MKSTLAYLLVGLGLVVLLGDVLRQAWLLVTHVPAPRPG